MTNVPAAADLFRPFAPRSGSPLPKRRPDILMAKFMMLKVHDARAPVDYWDDLE
jgi:hypothetical protein